MNDDKLHRLCQWAGDLDSRILQAESKYWIESEHRISDRGNKIIKPLVDLLTYIEQEIEKLEGHANA
jgi:hypothetical protein